MTELDPLAFQKSFSATQDIYNQANQNKLTQLAYNQKLQDVQNQNALNDLYKSSVNPDGTIDKTKLLGGAASAGLGSQIPTLQKQFSEQDKASREADKANIENGLKHFEAIGQIMSGVNDQQTYDIARQKAAQVFGPQLAQNLPAVYDPQTIAQNQAQAMTVKDRLEQQYKALGFGLDQQKFAYQQQNDALDQGVKMRGQDITARGQDMTDQRSRDALAQKTIADKAPTEFQAKSATFGARAEQADNILSNLQGQYSPAAVNAKNSLDSTPLIGGLLGGAANAMSGPTNQKADQAQRDFVNAILRQESGASISPSEFDNARKQYFPQPGDSQDVIAQKSANRQTAVMGFKNAAGKASFTGASVPTVDKTSALQELQKRAQSDPSIMQALKAKGLLQ